MVHFDAGAFVEENCIHRFVLEESSGFSSAFYMLHRTFVIPASMFRNGAGPVDEVGTYQIVVPVLVQSSNREIDELEVVQKARRQAKEQIGSDCYKRMLPGLRNTSTKCRNCMFYIREIGCTKSPNYFHSTYVLIKKRETLVHTGLQAVEISFH